jgi:hypothetical protein
VRVFRIELDVDRFQYLLPADDKDSSSSQPLFDGTQIEEWRPPAVYSYQPRLAAGDFWSFQMRSAAWATRPSATHRIQSVLAKAGQILPLPYQGEVFGLLNVTQCVECLDPDATEWIVGESTRKPIRIARYAFLPKRFPESPIFKLPQTARSEILCYEGVLDPVDEFKSIVERHQLTGLTFREIWSSDGR